MRLEAEMRSVQAARNTTDLRGFLFMRLSYVGYGLWQLEAGAAWVEAGIAACYVGE
jgi:hypothetical protein